MGGGDASSGDPEWIGRLVDWLIAFGSGPKGFLALAMVLFTVAAIFCLPQMFKALLVYKFDKQKFISEHKGAPIPLRQGVDSAALLVFSGASGDRSESPLMGGGELLVLTRRSQAQAQNEQPKALGRNVRLLCIPIL